MVNLLMGGMDVVTHKPCLYWIDYLASMAPVPYAAHGYAQYVVSRGCVPTVSFYLVVVVLICGRFYCLSILDKHHHPDISLEQGMKILEMCTDELKRRLPIDYKGVCSIPPLPLMLYGNILTISGSGQGCRQGWREGSPL